MKKHDLLLTHGARQRTAGRAQHPCNPVRKAPDIKGGEVAVRSDDPVDTLSVIKLPILVLAYRDVEAGALDLDERCLIAPEDLRNGALLHGPK